MFRKFRLRTQFYGPSTIIVGILILATAGLYSAISPINKEWNAYQSDVAQRQTLLMEIKSQFGYGGVIHNFKNYVLRGTDKYIGRLQDGFARMDALIGQYEVIVENSPEEKLALTSVARVAHQYRDMVNPVKQMVQEGASPQAIDSVVKIDDSPALAGFSVLDDAYQKLTAEANQSLTHRIDRVITVGMWGALIVILFIALGMFILSNSIISGITQIRDAMIKAEQGTDIGSRLPCVGKDEIADLATSYNALMDRFVSMITQVARSASSVGVVTVAQSAQVEETVRCVREQHMEIDQIATAMNEMSATVQEVAQNTNLTSEGAGKINTQADEGRQVMMETIHAIDELRSRVETAAQVIVRLEQESQGVSKVLEVISTLSEQTNLLALNAAIEAARAGTHGRGFAVVADEVRALAAKTKGSTDEISTIIERLQNQAREAVTAMQKSQENATLSSEKASEAGDALDHIVEEVRAISMMTTQIATAANEQSYVAEEMSRNISNINSGANTTSDLAEQTLSATATIGEKVETLRANTSQFTIDDVSVKLEQAKAAHLAWRIQLRAYLNGKGSLSKDQAVSHKDCALGKWYYSTGLAEFEHVPEMGELEKPHAELHGLIHRIIELQETGRTADAEKEYEKVGPLSEQIVALLDAIERKVA
jgi:methyl-accepting chemotaxis protein